MPTRLRSYSLVTHKKQQNQEKPSRPGPQRQGAVQVAQRKLVWQMWWTWAVWLLCKYAATSNQCKVQHQPTQVSCRLYVTAWVVDKTTVGFNFTEYPYISRRALQSYDRLIVYVHSGQSVCACVRSLTTLCPLPPPLPSRREGCLARPASCKPRTPRTGGLSSSHRLGMARWCWLRCCMMIAQSPSVLHYLKKKTVGYKYAPPTNSVCSAHVRSYCKVDG